MPSSPKKLVSHEYLESFITSQLDGDRDFFFDLLNKLKNQMDEFAKVKDLTKARVHAHKLRSSFQAFGCGSVDALLVKLEQASVDIKDNDWQKLLHQCLVTARSAVIEVEQVAEEIFLQKKAS